MMIDDCRKFLEPALAYSGGTHEWVDVVNGVCSGRMQLWPSPDAAAVTEIIKYPRKMVLNVFIAGGNMERLVDMLESAKAWGHAQGCDAIAMSGRRGWLKVLGKEGWEEQFTTMTSDILPCVGYSSTIGQTEKELS